MATVIAFTSGKGGVGKTNISTNLGLALAARNTKVCLFDADTGLANINILLGISPIYTIEHVLNGQKVLDDIIINHSSGISVVPAASGIKNCTNLDSQQISVLTRSLQSLEKKFDYLLIDTAAGIDSNVLDFVASAQFRVIVITSEPTSLTDSFALLKMMLIRGKKKSIYILVNKVKDYHTSQRVFLRFQKAVRNYLKIDVQYLGYLSNDNAINRAVSQQIPVVISYPNSSVSCGFASLADIIKRKFRNEKNLPFFSHYWTMTAQKSQIESKTVNTVEKEIKTIQASVPSSSPERKVILNKPQDTIKQQVTDETKSGLFDIYSLIEQQTLSESQLKELILTLESIYEKKHHHSLKDIHSIIALIMAENNEDKISQLYKTIANRFERQFSKKIDNPVQAIEDLMKYEQFSKNDFKTLLENFEDIYYLRFKEKYYAEENLLLSQIQQLISKKPE